MAAGWHMARTMEGRLKYPGVSRYIQKYPVYGTRRRKRMRTRAAGPCRGRKNGSSLVPEIRGMSTLQERPEMQ